MKKILYITFLIAINLSILKSLELTIEQKNLLERINSGYTSYKSIKTKFAQTDHENNVLKGWFILQRPKQARIEYETSNLRLIANNNVFIVEDTTLNQKTQLPLNQSIFSYLLEENSSLLSNDIEILDFVEESTKITLTLTLKKTPEIGKLSLMLDKNTGHILGWSVIDSTNNKTSIVLNSSTFSKKAFDNSSIFNTQRVINIKFDKINLSE